MCRDAYSWYKVYNDHMPTKGFCNKLIHPLSCNTYTFIAIIQYLTCSALCVSDVSSNPDAKRLYDNLLKKGGYNKLIRPVGNNSDKLTVKLGLRLSQLIDVVSGPFYATAEHKEGRNLYCILLYIKLVLCWLLL